MRKYNAEAIIEDVNMLDVLNRLNITVSPCTARTDMQTGNKRLILCPFHNDMHFGSASVYINYRKNFKGIYCFACGRGWNVVDLVRECANLNYTESLEFLADCCTGGREAYKYSDSKWRVVSASEGEDINFKKKNFLKGLLTTDDLNFIGVVNYPVSALKQTGAIIGCHNVEPGSDAVPAGFIAQKAYEWDKDKEQLDDVWYIKDNTIKYTFNEFVEDDPEGAALFLLTKLLFIIKDRESFINNLPGIKTIIAQNVVYLSKKEVKRAKKLYNKIMSAWAGKKLQYIA